MSGKTDNITLTDLLQYSIDLSECDDVDDLLVLYTDMSKVIDHFLYIQRQALLKLEYIGVEPESDEHSDLDEE